MQHIETIELGSSQSSITFSSIPQDYDDLVLKFSARGTSNLYRSTVLFEINGASRPNAIYETVRLLNAAGSVIVPVDSDDIVFSINGETSAANTFTNGNMYFSNYSSNSNKIISFDVVTENNNIDVETAIAACLYESSNAITTISAISNNSNFVSGSTFSLYGVTAGGSGTVTTA